MNLSKEEIFRRIKEPAAVRGTRAIFFKSLLNVEDLPTWSDILEHLDRSCAREADPARVAGLNPEIERYVGATVRKGQYYSMAEIQPEDIFPESSRFPGLMQLEEMFNEYHKPGQYMSDLFISFITGDDYATPHTDDYSHNFFVGCQGTVQWNIYEGEDKLSEPIESYLLEPGDALFVRGDVFHEVSVEKPRASIVFRIDADPSDQDSW